MSSADHTPMNIAVAGQNAVVCQHDYDALAPLAWYINEGYVIHSVGRYGKMKMHRIVNHTPKGLDTDHINRNRLDNRCTNLRTATKSLNARNRKLRTDNVSGTQGVNQTASNTWIARIVIGQERVYLGTFKTKTEAIRARREAEKAW